jgi:chorismate synthase
MLVEDVNAELTRRRQGYGRGGRMAIEADVARILSGVKLGKTLGTPISVLVENQDHINWRRDMSVEPLPDLPLRQVSVPRPGHADLPGIAKYGFDDIRNVLERASARETVSRVAAGAICKLLLRDIGVIVRGRVVQIGTEVAAPGDFVDPDSVDWDVVEDSPVGCDDSEAGQRMCSAIDRARETGESLGGVFEIWCWGTCPGVGGYAAASDRLDGRILGAMGSIPAIKGVEIGEAFVNAGQPGSRVHDEMSTLRTGSGSTVTRATNRAAGLEGGMTNGMPVVVRAAMKPIPTLTKPLASFDMDSGANTTAHVERSDVCAVPAARVVGEAVMAFVMAGAYLEKFGGDSMEQFRTAVRQYEADLEVRGLWRRSSL